MFGKKNKEEIESSVVDEEAALKEKERIDLAWNKYQEIVSSYKFESGQTVWVRDNRDYYRISKAKFVELIPLTYENFKNLDRIPENELSIHRLIKFKVDYGFDGSYTQVHSMAEKQIYSSFMESIPEDFRSLEGIENSQWDNLFWNTDPSVFYNEDYLFSIEEVNRALIKRIYKRLKSLLVGQYHTLPFKSDMSFCRVLNGYVLVNGHGNPMMIIPESEVEKEIQNLSIISVDKGNS